MAFQRDRDAGRSAVALLATCMVLLFGAGSCGFLILTVVDQPGWPLAGVAAFFLVLSTWLLTFGRTEQPQLRQGILAWLRGRDKTDPLKDYQPRLKRAQSAQFGTNAPPSLESVREAADDFAHWVPRSNVEDCHRPASQPRRSRS